MFTKKYTELILYLSLLLSLILHRFFSFPNLSIFILLLPLIFLPAERFGLKSPWNLSLLLIAPLYFLHPQNFHGLVFQAFAEELFFRAYLMARLSNLVVSILFTIPHLILYSDLWSVLTFFPSLIFGILYKKTDSLVFVSIIHLASNVLWFSLLRPYLLGPATTWYM